MIKNRMLKFEKLFSAYMNADACASANIDWEERRSMGPTLSHEQIYRPVNAAWNELITELKRKAMQKNPFAEKILSAVDSINESTAFIDAVDEYFEILKE